MKVLKATLKQKNSLEGFYLNGAFLQFIKDANNCYVVNVDVINDANFKEIKTELEQLPLIEYKPLIIND